MNDYALNIVAEIRDQGIQERSRLDRERRKEDLSRFARFSLIFSVHTETELYVNKAQGRAFSTCVVVFEVDANRRKSIDIPCIYAIHVESSVNSLRRYVTWILHTISRKSETVRNQFIEILFVKIS